MTEPARKTQAARHDDRPAAERDSRHSAAAAVVDNRPEAIAQRKLTDAINQSPQVRAQRALSAHINNSLHGVAQRAQLTNMFGEAAQLEGQMEEDELLQGQFAPVQRKESEEEELLQGKFATVQRQGPEEDDLLQGKFDPIQRQTKPEEEELLQGKLTTAQRQGPEDEKLLQGKFANETDSDTKENETGMPDRLKTGLEQLSGMDLSGVRVHYNSAKPVLVKAHAYTQGQDIHVAPGQERHLPHEGWHVVQQAQGRVKPTLQAKGVPINDDAGLEHEADVMGAKALQIRPAGQVATGPAVRAMPAAPQDRDPAEASAIHGANIGAFVEEARSKSLSTVAPMVQPKGFVLPTVELPEEKVELHEKKEEHPKEESPEPAEFTELIAGVRTFIAADYSENIWNDVDELRLLRKLAVKVAKLELSEKNKKLVDELLGKIEEEIGHLTSGKEEEAINLAFEQRGKPKAVKEVPPFSTVEEKAKKGQDKAVLAKYGYNWFTAQEHLAYVTFAKDRREYVRRMNVMKRLLTYRETETAGVLKPEMAKVATDLEGKDVGPGQVDPLPGKKGYIYKKGEGEDEVEIKAYAPGSQTLTSDIDITFSVKDRPAYEADLVQGFNKTFREDWSGLSSGIVFDVNAYTSGFMAPAAGHYVEGGEKKPHKVPLGAESEQYQQVKATKHNVQFALAFLPIREYFGNDKDKGEERWKQFKGATTYALIMYLAENLEGHYHMILAADEDVEAVFGTVEQLYEETQGALEAKKKEVGRRKPLRKKGEQHISAVAADMLYEEQLGKIKELLVKRRALLKRINKALEFLKEVESYSDESLRAEVYEIIKDQLVKDRQELAKNMKDAEKEQGKALVYANEAYYTGGAAVHVVKGMQGGEEVTLGRQQQIQALLMNIGYKLQHFAHHEKEGGLGHALVSTAKYGERVRDIVKQGQEEVGEEVKEEEVEEEEGKGKAAEGEKKLYKANVNPKLYELLKDDIEVLDRELNLIRNYKKTTTLVSPAAREAKAQKFMGEEKGMDKAKLEKTYIHIAENVLGPYYVDKITQKGRIWARKAEEKEEE